ncbi:uncharacterized protein LOC136078738 [Hydra vulgaris]|uniref:Uncharacterized protein LOC136078738 n=1 Tax=Hydra vulgaris TaxID=6087 RepID=A0ABM4BNE0_HYDVU
MAAEEARIRVLLDEIDSDVSWHQEGSDPSDSSDDEDELDVDEAADTDGKENEGSDEVDEEDAVSAADTNDNRVEGADDKTANLVENGILTETPKLLTRKRLRQPVNWKQNVRKRLREAGADPDSEVATSPKKGRNKKKFLPQETVQQICDHINSFPRVESHYNRANTKKEFLETELSLKKMFQLYKEIHTNDHVTTESKYRDIFNTKFNIAFHKPKKDRCDYCEEMKLIPTPSEEEELKYLDHLSKKLECKEERDMDRKNHKNGIDPTVAVVSFDMENVMALPKANVSNFF